MVGGMMAPMAVGGPALMLLAADLVVGYFLGSSCITALVNGNRGCVREFDSFFAQLRSSNKIVNALNAHLPTVPLLCTPSQ
jgi:hypothetical protein